MSVTSATTYKVMKPYYKNISKNKVEVIIPDRAFASKVIFDLFLPRKLMRNKKRSTKKIVTVIAAKWDIDAVGTRLGLTWSFETDDDDDGDDDDD